MGLTTNCAMELEERYDGSTSQGLRPPTIARVVPEGRLGMRVIVRYEVVHVVHRVLSWVMAADPRPSKRPLMYSLPDY